MITVFTSGPKIHYTGIVDPKNNTVDGTWEMPIDSEPVRILMEEKFGAPLGGMGVIKGGFEMNLPADIYTPIKKDPKRLNVGKPTTWPLVGTVPLKIRRTKDNRAPIKTGLDLNGFFTIENIPVILTNGESMLGLIGTGVYPNGDLINMKGSDKILGDFTHQGSFITDTNNDGVFNMITTFEVSRNGPKLFFSGNVERKNNIIEGTWELPIEDNPSQRILEKKFGIPLGNLDTIRGMFEMNLPPEMYIPTSRNSKDPKGLPSDQIDPWQPLLRINWPLVAKTPIEKKPEFKKRPTSKYDPPANRGSNLDSYDPSSLIKRDLNLNGFFHIDNLPGLPNLNQNVLSV
jgi:hypothetical protein